LQRVALLNLDVDVIDHHDLHPLSEAPAHRCSAEVSNAVDEERTVTMLDNSKAKVSVGQLLCVDPNSRSGATSDGSVEMPSSEPSRVVT
jgi:hypothetical protein